MSVKSIVKYFYDKSPCAFFIFYEKASSIINFSSKKCLSPEAVELEKQIILAIQKSRTPNEYHNSYCRSSKILSMLPNTIKSVAEYLANNGIKKVEYLGHGFSSLALKYNSDKVVRIGYKFISLPRFASDSILQPISYNICKNFKIEILEKLEPISLETNAGYNILSKIYKNLKKQKKIFFDIDFSNIGVNKTGDYLIIDAGAVYEDNFFNRLILKIFKHANRYRKYHEMKKMNLID